MLWKAVIVVLFGLVTCQPDASSPVGSKCRSTAHLQDSTVWSHHWCAISLHWLQVSERILFVVAVLTFMTSRVIGGKLPVIVLHPCRWYRTSGRLFEVFSTAWLYRNTVSLYSADEGDPNTERPATRRHNCVIAVGHIKTFSSALHTWT